MVEVTQEHISWATSIAQHLCHPADRDAAIRLVSDGLARFEQEVLARASTAPDAEPVADRPVTSNPVDDRGSGNTSDKPDAYLIRKGGAYYRPNAEDYTRSKADAGRYTLEDAIRHSHPNGPDGPRDGMSYEPAPAEPVAPAVVEAAKFRIGDRVKIVAPEWEQEPPHYITGIDWHPKHGVTYTTSEVWPPKVSGFFVQGLTDEWRDDDLALPAMGERS